MYSFMNKELIIESDKNFNLVQFFHEFKNNKGFLSTQSYTLYFTRRIIYTLNIFYFNTQPYVQYAILTFGAAVQLAFSLYFKPYKENLDMIFSVTCEIAVFVSIAFSLFFIEGLNSKFVQSCELAILTCVSTVLCSGIVLTFVNFVRFIREKFRKEIKIEIFVDKVERIEASEVVDLSVDGKSCINEFMERSLANAESERSQIFDEISKFEEGEDLNKNLDVELNKVWQTDFVVSESLANTKSKLNID